MKVVSLGMSGVGKSCLIARYVNGIFTHQESTVGSAYFVKREEVENKSVVLGVWDTAGAERFESMTKIYYRNAAAAVVCWDLTDETSYSRLKFWVNELRNSDASKCRIYLVGTKADLLTARARGVLEQEVQFFANSVGASGVFETSAVSGLEVDHLFQKITADFLKDNPDFTSVAVSAVTQPAVSNSDCSC